MVAKSLSVDFTYIYILFPRKGEVVKKKSCVEYKHPRLYCKKFNIVESIYI